MTMKRWVWPLGCTALALGLLACGWLVPAHLRAVDARVLMGAGRNTPSLVERRMALVKANNPAAGQMLAEAARVEFIPGSERLRQAVTNAATSAGHFSRADAAQAVQSMASDAEPITDLLIRLENRDRTLETLGHSKNPATRELLRCRELTNTVLFSASSSASGQAFDAALSVCGLLLDDGKLSGPMSNAVSQLVGRAVRENNPEPLEQVLMAMMSLGQRLNWGELVEFAGSVEDGRTFGLLAHVARTADKRLAVVFAGVVLSGQPGAVARYLLDYSRTGLDDLGAALHFGAGGVKELVRRDQRVYSSEVRRRIVAGLGLNGASSSVSDDCWRAPGIALAAKWFLYLCGGFLLAVAMHFARPAVRPLERPLVVRGFHLARESLFALGFLLVVLLLSEPFLAQESQKVDFHFRLRLPAVGGAVAAGVAGAKLPFMNPTSLLTLLLFFVLQALLYTACLVKLAEIRRQNVQARVKLRLLENEEHLFDAGLYLGFAGTIVSLILVSLGVSKFSLMAAYSSTSFGIIFVSIFKIFHLRPVRRLLLMESETATAQPFGATVSPSFATPT